jgi:hypothetical protein
MQSPSSSNTVTGNGLASYSILLWALTELYRKETQDGSLAFDEGIE